ncbi:hypothetical protein LEP1GSC165_3808 [Leptospira santarosai str. CBC523]|nr:hypothetical protein LEP1GSC165_3808 [Leptospira santarosai str. CBC523]
MKNRKSLWYQCKNVKFYPIVSVKRSRLFRLKEKISDPNS